MIDLHCHILDETPCGPVTFNESLEMCRQAQADGVHTIVATPRWEVGASEPPLPFAECERKLKELEHRLDGAVSFKLGFLMDFRIELPQLVSHYGPLVALGDGRYVFISLPSLRIPSDTEDVWEALFSIGYFPILARPECNPAVRNDPKRLSKWAKSGIKFQIDSASVIGLHGREVQRFAGQIVQLYEKSVVVSSNMRRVDARNASLKSAREELVKKAGVRCAQLLVNENPAAIIKADDTKQQRGRINSSPLSLMSRLRTFSPRRILTSES